MVGHAYSRRRMCSHSAARAGERGTRERAKKQTQEPSRKEIFVDNQVQQDGFPAANRQPGQCERAFLRGAVPMAATVGCPMGPPSPLWTWGTAFDLRS